VHGFTTSDIQLQTGIVDSFIEHQKPHCLSELLDDTSSHRTPSASEAASTSSAVKSQLSQSHSRSKKCVEKASFVKRQYRSSFSKLRLHHKHKRETAKSSRKY